MGQGPLLPMGDLCGDAGKLPRLQMTSGQHLGIKHKITGHKIHKVT